MSNLPTKLRLGAILLFSFIVLNRDGSRDESATVGNVNMSLEDVTDKDGNPIDPNLFATFEEVSEDVDKATITSDEALDGATGTFVGTTTVSWPNPVEGGDPITKELRAVGTATLAADPSAGDTLEMVVTLQ